MILTSRAGLRVELPDEQGMTDKGIILSLAGRIYKARRWMNALSIRDSLLKINMQANVVRDELELPRRPFAIADDPMRSLEDITESDLEWISGIAAWHPDWKITAPPTWGMHR